MHERGYACGMQIGKVNKGCRICTCACIRSEPTVQLVYVCRRVPCIFGIIIVRQPGRCVAARHDSVRDLKYSRTLGYTHIWITKQGVFIGRKSCWSKRIRVRILDWPVSRERCNGALSCWAHVSGIACEKDKLSTAPHTCWIGFGPLLSQERVHLSRIRSRGSTTNACSKYLARL